MAIYKTAAADRYEPPFTGNSERHHSPEGRLTIASIDTDTRADNTFVIQSVRYEMPEGVKRRISATAGESPISEVSMEITAFGVMY